MYTLDQGNAAVAQQRPQKKSVNYGDAQGAIDNANQQKQQHLESMVWGGMVPGQASRNPKGMMYAGPQMSSGFMQSYNATKPEQRGMVDNWMRQNGWQTPDQANDWRMQVARRMGYTGTGLGPSGNTFQGNVFNTGGVGPQTNNGASIAAHNAQIMLQHQLSGQGGNAPVAPGVNPNSGTSPNVPGSLGGFGGGGKGGARMPGTYGGGSGGINGPLNSDNPNSGNFYDSPLTTLPRPDEAITRTEPEYLPNYRSTGSLTQAPDPFRHPGMRTFA